MVWSCEQKNNKGPMWKVNKIEDSLIKKGKSYGSKRTQDKCDKQEESIMQ